MRATIHLIQKGVFPLRCLACGEVAEVGQSRRFFKGAPAVCGNARDWETIYLDHPNYRRCIDTPDRRDGPERKVFPIPDRPGYYWAEWRIAEDGTWPPGVEHITSFTPEVVCVRVDLGSGELPNVSDFKDPLVVDICGFDKAQALEDFVWRSERLSAP